MIVAEDCGNWTELDPDELIVQLDEMLKNGKRPAYGKSVAACYLVDLQSAVVVFTLPMRRAMELEHSSHYLENIKMELQRSN
ncbi:hypothetical protein [Pseudomonas helleri]|uniref:Uncharacterized protein n=1 Tax=Pseudomonas helleri TaxID=1608996 RepID=A0A6A7YXX2_9PSED|nr:hypothetical protein [Pseudomonas helleri]MQT81851.1 hypothetical protein [Pseudomonas helleri]